MARFAPILKSVVTALFVAGAVSPAARAQDDPLDDLFDQLRNVGPEAAAQIENRIWSEWSKSGSPSMDLLLERGRDALDSDDLVAASEHFSALIDHAPDFAEGYNARAMAYYRMGLYGLALDDLQQVLARNPRHFGAIGGLALILQELGYDSEALDAWRAVTEINPHSEGAAEAIERLERAVEGTAL